MVHLVIHSLLQFLAPGYLPLFTSDGLNLYFYALTAHFGHWLALGRRGRKARRWLVEAGLIYGQVKKRYRQCTPAMAAGRTNRRWTALEVLCYPLSPMPQFTL